MANIGRLAAEIISLVWDTPANFNGFRIFAALLHSTLVLGVSQICSFEQRAPPIFGRAAITLGIGPHCSCLFITSAKEGYVFVVVCLFVSNFVQKLFNGFA